MAKCKFYDIQCINKREDECEFEGFLREFSIHLCDLDKKEYKFLCCPDKIEKEHNDNNRNKEVDLIIFNNYEEFIAIEAKGICFEHLEEMHSLIEIVEHKLINYFRQNIKIRKFLLKYGVSIEFNESIIKLAKVINSDLLLQFCRNISDEILNLKNNDEKIMHMYLNRRQQLINKCSNIDDISKLAPKGKKRRRVNLLINDFRKIYENRKKSQDVMEKYLKEINYVNLLDDTYNFMDYYECMSRKRIDMVFKIKRTPSLGINIGKRVSTTAELKETIDDKFKRHFMTTNEKFKVLKEQNRNVKIRTILFLNRRLEIDSNIFDEEVINKWIEKFASDYNEIDEVWTEKYRIEVINESIDFIEEDISDEKSLLNCIHK